MSMETHLDWVVIMLIALCLLWILKISIKCILQGKKKDNIPYLWSLLMRHQRPRTEPVTDPSPTQTGMGTSWVKFWSSAPIPVTPVPTNPHRFTFPCPSLDDTKTGKPHALIQIAIGMKAMVVLNIATEADVTNRTWGEIQHIILDE
jgi:hypothetical protein